MSERETSVKFFHETACPKSGEIATYRENSVKVTLNVGGERHEILWSSLLAIPDSRLGLLAVAVTHEEIMQQCDAYSLIDGEFFFDRDPE